jgi:hypothetical protein
MGAYKMTGGAFDSQDFLSKLPGFIWAKYPGEKHLIRKL